MDPEGGEVSLLSVTLCVTCFSSRSQTYICDRALVPIHQELSKIITQNVIERTANSAHDNETVASSVEDVRDALTTYQVIIDCV